LTNVLYNSAVSKVTKKKTKGKTNHSFKDSSRNDIALFTAPSNKGNGRNGRNRRNGGNNNADCKKFTGVCYHCNKKGHKANQCWQKVEAVKMEKVRTIEVTRLVVTIMVKLSVGTVGNLGILRNSAGTRNVMRIRDLRIGPRELVVAIKRCLKHL